MKSRKFEPLPQNDATRTVVEFRKNGVSERAKWLQSAFAKKEDAGSNEEGGAVSVADRAKKLQEAFAKKEAAQHNKGRRDDDGHANVAYAEVGPIEELTSSGMCDVSQYHQSQDDTCMPSECNESASVASASTCASSSFSIGKQMLESRTERNSARGSSSSAVEADRDDDNGGSVNASVQLRRAALERREEEARVRAEAKGSAVKARWEVDSTSHTYTKKIVPEDDRKCTAVKKLSDLP